MTFLSGSLVGMTSRNLGIALHNQYARVQYLKSTAAATACLAIGHKTRDSRAHDVGGDSLNREKVELTKKRTSERHGRTTERPPVVSREKVRVRLLIGPQRFTPFVSFPNFHPIRCVTSVLIKSSLLD